ncbi:hypothetical protein F7731_07335 [Cytobacillus depressus]|uniref:Uncharacterized protein n=1 Tax=Cytobacillus depressus TaxID=1602942 RepID=A0A6L3V9D4_9BACI|nr:hypothetical protein [Cytobacillus depressus]KAB2337415.1 hypothetical protein F7731_07335 [Cytobacillus depressus]
MFLTYNDLANLFPKVIGIKDPHLLFHTVTTNSNMQQYRGVFIPIGEESGELKTAIENGAVAVLWQEGKEIPRYTPNHFPIFLTNDLLKGLKDMMELYIEKISKNHLVKKDGTNFLFSNDIILKENDATYDIALKLEKIREIKQLQDGKEGAK